MRTAGKIIKNFTSDTTQVPTDRYQRPILGLVPCGYCARLKDHSRTSAPAIGDRARVLAN